MFDHLLECLVSKSVKSMFESNDYKIDVERNTYEKDSCEKKFSKKY